MKPEERTFVAIKPDGVKRGLIGKILSRFEDNTFDVTLVLGPLYHLYLEDDINKTDRTGKIEIQGLSRKIYDWVKDEKERKYLLAAIYLYVYLNREREEWGR